MSNKPTKPEPKIGREHPTPNPGKMRNKDNNLPTFQNPPPPPPPKPRIEKKS